MRYGRFLFTRRLKYEGDSERKVEVKNLMESECLGNMEE